MNKLQFKSEWRLARSGIESLPFINKLLVIRDTFNDINNPVYISLKVHSELKKTANINFKNRSITLYGKETPVFSTINRSVKL